MIDPTIARFLPDPDVASCKAASGVAYLRHGAGEPLLLFHGGAGSWSHWIKNIAALGRHFQVVAFDAPGYGASDAVDREIERDDYLELIFRAVDEVTAGAGRVHIAAFSFGSSLASASAVHLGGRAASISLTGASGFAPPHGRPMLTKSTRKLAEELGRAPTEAELRDLYRSNLGRLMIWDVAKIDKQAIDMQVENVARTRFDSRRFSWSGRTPKYLARTSCPLTVIYGEHDASAYPSIGDRVGQCREARPDMQDILLPACGHWAMYEAPEAINGALIAFHGGA